MTNRFLAKLASAAAIVSTIAIAPASASILHAYSEEHSKSFFATSAVSDDLHGGNSNHSVWMPFFKNTNGSPLRGKAKGSAFHFDPAGVLTVNKDGHATLTGEIVSHVDDQFRATVDLKFRLREGPGTGGLKKELKSSAYVNKGGPIDPSSWSYFDLVSGKIVGEDELDGVSFDLKQRPHNSVFPAQVGLGANGKNGNLGLAVWFYLTANDECVAQLCHVFGSKTYYGDFNLDLVETPLPAGALLFLTGLTGFSFARRARR
ncbi:MAG: hypothetical protein AAFR21_10750 [Pseudomonadota bacterium]